DYVSQRRGFMPDRCAISEDRGAVLRNLYSARDLVGLTHGEHDVAACVKASLDSSRVVSRPVTLCAVILRYVLVGEPKPPPCAPCAAIIRAHEHAPAGGPRKDRENLLTGGATILGVLQDAVRRCNAVRPSARS